MTSSCVKWMSGYELMERWGTEVHFSIIEAIKNGLQVHERIVNSGVNIPVKIDCAEAYERLNIPRMPVWGIERPNKKHLEFDALVFDITDVSSYETENGIDNEHESRTTELERPGRRITVNALKNDPVFKNIMDAIQDVNAFCDKAMKENGRAATETEIIGYFIKNWVKPGTLPKHVFDEILKAIPKSLRRQRGERNHGDLRENEKNMN